MNRQYLARVKRQLPILGTSGQRTIHKSRLCIVGASGNGSPACSAAALIGFGQIDIIDPQLLEPCNCNRFVLGGWKDLGHPKAEICARGIREIDPSIRVSAVVDRVETDEGLQALSKADAVILCVDRNEPRIVVNEYCAELGKPLLDLGCGGVIRDGVLRSFGWRASLFMPGHACLECLFLDQQPMRQSHISYCPLNMQVVGVGLDLLVAYLTGYREVNVNHIVCDVLAGRISGLMVSSRDDCPHCGSRTRRNRTRREDAGRRE